MVNTPLDQPEDVPAAFVEAWQRRDPDGIADLFDEDAEFVNVTGLWWHDRHSIRRAHAYGLSVIFADSKLRLRDTRVKQLTDDIAVVHARMVLTGQTPVGEVGAPKPRQTLMSLVVRRGPGGWRCVSAQNTDIIAGMETNVVDADGHLLPVDYRSTFPTG
ncbi:YybH family protein [Micropruina sp.]|uniref:YybH family protein n=1 Tax=Micropruina sp. TaxID=2737536 RepID=UPI0039E3AD60